MLGGRACIPKPGSWVPRTLGRGPPLGSSLPHPHPHGPHPHFPRSFPSSPSRFLARLLRFSRPPSTPTPLHAHSPRPISSARPHSTFHAGGAARLRALARPAMPGGVPVRGAGAHNVGLGTARGFATASPQIVQMVGNVAVGLRAAGDKAREEAGRKRRGGRMEGRVRRTGRKQERKARREVLGAEKVAAKRSLLVEAAEDAYFHPTLSLLNEYFTLPLSHKSTLLLAPLSPSLSHLLTVPPTPSSFPSSLLDPTTLHALLHLRATHASHALRLSALHAALAPHADELGYASAPASGAPVLRAVLRGWSEADVRALVGGGRWFYLAEVDAPSPSSSPAEDDRDRETHDIVASQFVLPQLEFSAASAGGSPISLAASDIDYFDSGSEMDDSDVWGSPRIGLSARFGEVRGR